MSGVETAWIIAAAAATATVAEGYGQYQEAKSEARLQDANAAILRQNARRKRLETAMNEDAMRKENRQKVAKNLAASIEQGGGGSPTSIGVLGQQATTLEQNALNLRYEGLSQAENMDINANYLNQQAKATKKAGKNAFNMSLIKAPISGAMAYYTAGGSMAAEKGAQEGWTSLGNGVSTRGGTSAYTIYR